MITDIKRNLALLFLLPALSIAGTLESLPSYNVNLEESSISGVSAGGFMAGQFHIAFSSKLKGVGIIAGGPYNCAQGSLYQATTQAGGLDGRCMEHPELLTDAFLDQLYQDALDLEAKGDIDPLENIMEDKVYIFHGTLDITVKTPVGDTVEPWYLRTGIPSENIKYVRFETGHTYPTDSFGNPCEFDTEPPWVSNCNYDGAGETLKHIYGNLNPRNDSGTLTGRFIEFDQSEFLNPAVNSMQPKGVAYVPKSCAEGEDCRIHTFFHGCEQVYDSTPSDRVGDNASYDGKGIWTRPYPIMGDTIWKNSGLNKWADTNNFIILYPQAKKSYSPFNPKGCWDWWGYINSGGPYDYATKKGPQMEGVMKMMQRLASGIQEGGSENTTDEGNEGEGEYNGIGNDSCPSVTGTVKPDLIDAGVVEGSYYYYTTGDRKQLWAYKNDVYTVYIGSDGKGYMEDPNNCNLVDGNDDQTEESEETEEENQNEDENQNEENDNDITPPSSVKGLLITEVTHTQISLNWSDNREDDLYGYLVYMAESSGNSFLLTYQPLLESEFLIPTLRPGTSYTITVIAVDENGNRSDPVKIEASTLEEQNDVGNSGEDEGAENNSNDNSGNSDENTENEIGESEGNKGSGGGGSTDIFMILFLIAFSIRRKK